MRIRDDAERTLRPSATCIVRVNGQWSLSVSMHSVTITRTANDATIDFNAAAASAKRD